MSIRSAYLAFAISSCLALPVLAQDDDVPWTIGNGDIKMSGLVDAYYSHNLNNPASGFNTLRNFEVKSRQFSLNMAEFSLYQDAAPIGFRIDLGFGRAWDIFHAADPGTPDIQRYIPQAFITAKKGTFTFDFGKFYTSVGGELTENNFTWHYGRGYMYTNGPYYHMGLRMAKQVSEKFTVGMSVVNGWNNVEDNNTGKTLGFNANWTPSGKVSFLYNSYVGPEKTGTNKGFRQIHEGLMNYSPTSWWTGYLDYYHGREAQAGGVGTPAANWDAIGISSKFNTNDHNSLAFRYEYYADTNGFSTGYGSKLNLQEFTATYAYQWTQGLKMLWEYRHDWSDQPFFERGALGQHKHQDTFTVGFVAFFGGK